MKRIQSACIMQTIRFSQKDDAGYSVSHMSEMNRAELEKYKMQLEKNKIRYVIDKENEQSDGSILICIRKEYNGRTDVGLIFRKGEYVVYRNSEICVVGENINRCFDGKNSIEYLTLHPTESNGTYYVPVDRSEMCLRPVLAKEKLLEIIDSMPKIESIWINDKNLRIESFGDAVKSGDYSLILPMMNAIYNERKKRAEQGKHITSADERAFNCAKHLLHSEIAYSLGIAPDMVEQFIEDRINK